MISKANQKLLKVAAVVALFSCIFMNTGRASLDTLGGYLIQATPFDHQMSHLGDILGSYSVPLTQDDASSNDLFILARSMQYVPDLSGHDYWQTPEETQARWAGDCEDKAVWLFAKLKKHGHSNVRLVIGRYRPVDGNLHVWVTMADDQNNLWILDPTLQKKIWKSSDFSEGLYRPLYSFDGINRYRHDIKQ